MFLQTFTLMKKCLFCASVFFIITLKCFSQVEIAGPVCVSSELNYRYEIKGSFKESDKISICIEGGSIIGSAVTCIDSIVSFVSIEWNKQMKQGKLTVNSSLGNVVQNVQIIAPLQGGTIDTSDREQTIPFKSVPAAITCSPASGGNCEFSYVYQWQESSDNVHWKDIKEAKSRDLSFSFPVKRTTFFRRKVTESFSSSVTYSDMAALYVKIPANEVENVYNTSN